VIDHASDALAAPVLPPLMDLQTRFIYAFHFRSYALQEATASLTAHSLGQGAVLWEAARPPETYTDEILEQVANSLFAAREGAGSGYLRIPHKVSSNWLEGAAVRFPSGKELAIFQSPRCEIELFLTNLGVGMLSVPLTPGQCALDWRSALEFNCFLAHARHGIATEIRLPHPADDQKKWSQMLVSAREQVKPAPPRFAPLEERLGAPGASFTLAEIVARLIRPLEAFGLQAPWRGLAAYAVAQLPPDPRFAKRSLTAGYATFLSALAQVDDPSSAAVSEEPVPGVNEFWRLATGWRRALPERPTWLLAPIPGQWMIHRLAMKRS
jgi:hypothetical protein